MLDENLNKKAFGRVLAYASSTEDMCSPCILFSHSFALIIPVGLERSGKHNLYVRTMIRIKRILQLRVLYKVG